MTESAHPAWLSRLAAPRAALGQLLLLSGLRLWLAARLPLTGDEALMWYWTKWPDWCYVEHPGLMPAVTLLFTRLLGDHAWAIRLGAVLAGAGILAVIYRLGAKLRDRETGWLCALALGMSPLFTAGSTLQLTDIYYVSLSLGALYSFYSAGTRPSRYLWGGLWAGLAINAKLLAGLFPIALGIGVAWARPRDLRRKEPWLAGLLCLLLTLPPLLWNRAHGWPTVLIRIGHHPLDEFSLRYTARLVIAGLVLLTPFLFLPALRMLARLPALWRAREPGAVFFGLPSALLLGVVAAKSLRSSVDFHWAMFAWVALLLLAARDGLGRRWLLAGALAGASLSGIAIAAALRPAWIPDEFRLPGVSKVDGRGAKLALAADRALAARLDAELDADPRALLMSDGYGSLSRQRLALAGRTPPPDIALMEAQRRNAANFSLLWEREMAYEGRSALVFTEDDPPDNARKQAQMRRLYADCCRAPDVTVAGADGGTLGRVLLWRCSGFRGFSARALPPDETPVAACAGAAR